MWMMNKVQEDLFHIDLEKWKKLSANSGWWRKLYILLYNEMVHVA